MADKIKRAKALKLRKKGKSYSYIKQKLQVAKSTLSYWLRDYPLTREQINNLRAKNPQRIERYRETMRQKRLNRIQQYYQEQKKILLPLSERELMIAGLFMYWGEGSKTSLTLLNICNTDPAVIKFGILWMTKILKIPKQKIKLYLHLYQDMNPNKETEFWSKTLNINKKQFGKTYIKSTSSIAINHQGFGHGTCTINFNNTVLKEKVMMAIKVMRDYSDSQT